MASAVKLYVYDLSQGMAKQMSMALTGRQIDGIWHTSVVVYGTEYFYGQGIMTAAPGTTHHGQPLQIIDMGETFLPQEVLLEYIESQQSFFTAEKYHLLDFNCNTFTNALCQFLTGQNIPDHITSLPADFLSTPFGQQLLPMIENMFGQSQLRPPVSAPAAAPAAAAAAAPQQTPALNDPATLSMLRDISSAAMSASPAGTTQPQQVSIQHASNLAALERWLKSYRAVIVFFTSASCPPCRMIKPDFERLIQEKNSDSAQIKILGVIVDTSVAFDAASKYGIRATPTFMLFQDGQKFQEFRGANYAELQSSVNFLLFTVFPPHPHRKIQLRAVLDLPNAPVLYKTPGKADLISGKLDEFMEQDGITLQPEQRSLLSDAIQKGSVNDLKAWENLVDHLLDKLAFEHQFPLLDIFRTVLATPAAGEHYTADSRQLVRIMDNHQKGDMTKAVHLLTLRVACNIFAHTVLSSTCFTSTLPSAEPQRTALTQLLISSLLSPESQVRQVAAALAFNCSTVIAADRLAREKGVPEGAPEEDDDWQVEIVSAVMDVLQKEQDEEVIHRLLAAIAKFVFLAPSDASSLPDLLDALDIKGVCAAKKEQKCIKAPKVVSLANDVVNLVAKFHA
ncbi:PPPDE putative peptidase domain-domain-containing protein [Syncephalastrum racemosum]|uniref:PPPDE putative peptidase domain-domain-containing protein n=1 Tax=Syncephalastrum racemosum TaxID=13706 RepID=A0A1X2HFN0_SYNRA|nr:PPPDE putative peptidase domain-domain-containing protein [Syncephalastrum racemosum]